MKYPNRLRLLREARGMSQAQLAAAIGVQKAAISKYDNGSVELLASRLRAVADVLMVQPEELFSEQPPRVVNRVAEVRAAAGLTQADLANRLDWPLWKVAALEMATRHPPGDAVLEVAEALDCGLRHLFFDLTAASPETQRIADMYDGLREPDRQSVFRVLDALSKSKV